MAVLDRIPVERVVAEAETVNVGRMLLKLLVGFFVLIGWLAGKASLAVRVAVAGVRIGWHDARRQLEAARGPAG